MAWGRDNYGQSTVPEGLSDVMSDLTINSFINIIYSSNNPISGFQFDLSDIAIIGAESQLGDVYTNPSSSLVVGVDTDGEELSTGSGLLALVYFEEPLSDIQSCLSNVVIAYSGGIEYPVSYDNECVEICVITAVSYTHLTLPTKA